MSAGGSQVRLGAYLALGLPSHLETGQAIVSPASRASFITRHCETTQAPPAPHETCRSASLLISRFPELPVPQQTLFPFHVIHHLFFYHHHHHATLPALLSDRRNSIINPFLSFYSALFFPLPYLTPSRVVAQNEGCFCDSSCAAWIRPGRSPQAEDDEDPAVGATG